jgi:hypothetical protein
MRAILRPHWQHVWVAAPRAQVSAINIRLRVRVTRLQGTFLVWVPPPPGDRAWGAFVAPPVMELDVKPVVRAARPSRGSSPNSASHCPDCLNDAMQRHVLEPFLAAAQERSPRGKNTVCCLLFQKDRDRRWHSPALLDMGLPAAKAAVCHADAWGGGTVPFVPPPPGGRTRGADVGADATECR